MTRVTYSTSWVNWTTSGSGTKSGTSYPYNLTWSKTRDANTGAGYVTASMNGIATLWWGGTCVFLPTNDGENIS